MFLRYFSYFFFVSFVFLVVSIHIPSGYMYLREFSIIQRFWNPAHIFATIYRIIKVLLYRLREINLSYPETEVPEGNNMIEREGMAIVTVII